MPTTDRPRWRGAPAFSWTWRCLCAVRLGGVQRYSLLWVSKCQANTANFRATATIGDLLSPVTTDALVECTQRPRHANGSMRGLHQQTTGVRLSLPTDVSGKGWTVSRLADAWVEPKIAHQVRWAREPRDIPDHGHERDGRGQADSWDGHQAQHPTVRKRGLGDTFNGPVELGFQGVEQSEHTVDLMALLDGQRDTRPTTRDRLCRTSQ